MGQLQADSQISIVTDSGSDLDRDFAAKRGIGVLPLGVEIAGEQFMDRVDLSPDELFRRMRTEKAVARTSQITPGAAQASFEAIVANGNRPLYISLSSKLSGTYASAAMAAEAVPEAVLVDSKAASVGQALIVLEAQALADAGSSMEAITTRVKWLADRMEHLFSVDSLEYLHRGGRISHTKAIVASLLSIKPVLHFADGSIYPLENTRSRKKALARMVELMGERGVDLGTQTIGISHAGDPEAATQLEALVRQVHGCTSFFVSEIGASLGAHTGPGTIALFFLGKGQGGAVAD